MGDGGKGSGPRPFSVPKDEFDNNHERTFGKKPPKPRWVPPPLPDIEVLDNEEMWAQKAIDNKLGK